MTELESAFNLNNIAGEIGEWHQEGLGQNSYVNLVLGYLDELFYVEDEEGNLTLSEYAEEFPNLFKVYELMKKGALPEEFLLLIWW